MNSAMTVSSVAPEVMNVRLSVWVTLVSRMVRSEEPRIRLVVLTGPVEVDDRVVDGVPEDGQDGRDCARVHFHAEHRIEGQHDQRVMQDSQDGGDSRRSHGWKRNIM